MALRNQEKLVAVLCFDIAGFSTLRTVFQLHVISGFVTHLHILFPASLKSKINWMTDFPSQVFSSTGDGFIVAFYCRSQTHGLEKLGEDLLKTVKCLIEVGRMLEVRIRFGLDLGAVLFYEELHDRIGMCGNAINMAVRIMDIGGSEHILCSEEIYEKIFKNNSRLYNWQFSKTSPRRLKHDQMVKLKNIWQIDDVDKSEVKYGDRHKPPVEVWLGFKYAVSSLDDKFEIPQYLDIINAMEIKCQATSGYLLSKLLLEYAKCWIENEKGFELNWEKIVFYLPTDKLMKDYNDEKQEPPMAKQRKDAKNNLIELMKIGQKKNKMGKGSEKSFEVHIQYIDTMPNCALLGFDPEASGTVNGKVGKIRFTLYLWGVHSDKSPSLDANHPGSDYYLANSEYGILLDAFRNDRIHVVEKLILKEDGTTEKVLVDPDEGI